MATKKRQFYCPDLEMSYVESELEELFDNYSYLDGAKGVELLEITDAPVFILKKGGYTLEPKAGKKK